jgi:hypothetical protein
MSLAEPSDVSRHSARLMLLLLLAPALLWLLGLIVLPHVELGILSLRQRVAPRVYTSPVWRSSPPLLMSRCTGTPLCALR